MCPPPAPTRARSGYTPDDASICALICIPTAMAMYNLPTIHARTQCLRPVPSDCASSLHPVPPAHAYLPTFSLGAFVPACADVGRVHAQSHASTPKVHASYYMFAPGTSRPRLLPHVHAQCNRFLLAPPAAMCASNTL